MKKILSTVVTLIALALAALGYIDFPNQQSPSNNSTQSSTASLNEFPDAKSSQKEQTKTGTQTQNTASLPHGKWSNTKPAINLPHIFHGEINRRNKPVGYHSRPGGVDPKGARIVKIKDKPNRYGVYTALIEVYDADDKTWKTKSSSFFPDSLSAEQVIKLISYAYKNRTTGSKNPWTGPSGQGFDVQGYTLSRGDINTAFPLYRR